MARALDRRASSGFRAADALSHACTVNEKVCQREGARLLRGPLYPLHDVVPLREAREVASEE